MFLLAAALATLTAGKYVTYDMVAGKPYKVETPPPSSVRSPPGFARLAPWVLHGAELLLLLHLDPILIPRWATPSEHSP